MASLPIKSLDGESGYRRWKESILLRLRTLNLDHVLFNSPPPSSESDDVAAGSQWERDDLLCRGHILHTLSDRLFDIFSHHSTSKDLWLALERSYMGHTRFADPFWRVSEFKFDESKPVLEEPARLESAAATTSLKKVTNEEMYCHLVRMKIPYDYAVAVLMCKSKGQIWNALIAMEGFKRDRAEQEGISACLVQNFGNGLSFVFVK